MKGETIFRKRCAEFLGSLENCYYESIQQVTIRGSADIIACIQGFGVWAEIKDEAGVPDPLQVYKASNWRNQGKGIAFVWRPQNHELVKRFLQQLNAGILDRPMLIKLNKEENL